MPVWINEVHYDNSTTNDPGEFIEIAGTAGTDLTGWTIVLYNGSNNSTYSTRALTGTIPDQGNGFGTVFLSYTNTVQNGSPDAIALVDASGKVIQFLSYEGTMTALNGPAMGMTSTDIGVAETNTTPAGSSLGLTGTGDEYSDFTWSVLTSSGTPGGANTGQTFQAPPALPTLSIADVTANEGDGGTTIFTFTVSLDAPAPAGGVTFDIATADGTAIAGTDYVAKSLTGQTIPAGSSTYAFTVTVNSEAAVELNEDFLVNVTNIVGATAGDTQAVGIITNDDVAPTPGELAVGDVTLAEGNAGTTAFTFTVSRTNGSAGTVTVDYATVAGTALAGQDYTATSGTLTFLDGVTSQEVTVQVNGDLANEADEAFTLQLSNVTGGATISDASGAGTITNDDAPPAVSISDATLAEGNGGTTNLVFTISLTAASSSPVTVDFATANGSATAGSDYLAVSGTVTFAAGVTTQTVSVPIVGDTSPEATETLSVTLSNPAGATIADGSAVGTISNDDGAAYFSLASGDFSENWTDTSRITTADNWSGVPFIIGYLGDIDAGSPTGVDPRTLTGPALGAVDVIPNLASTTSTSGGVGEFEIADPTIGLQGSGTADAPSIVLYMDASGRTDIRLQANLRDIDTTADNAVQPVNVQYRTSPTGAWTNAPGGYFSDVTTGGSATQTTALDIILPAGANNAPQLEIRIMTTNAAGSDEWVGIDDIIVSSVQGPASYSVADAAAFEGTGGTSALGFTITRTGEATGAATVDYTIGFAGGGFSASANDFAPGVPLSGTVSFAAGETTRTIVLDLEPDANPEANEAFTVTLTNPSSGGNLGDATATGTIVNDDGDPPFVTVADAAIVEGDAGTTILTFTVTRTGGTEAFSVDFFTTGGSATAGSDYDATSGTLSFAEGENSKTIDITIDGDTAAEFAETLNVQLSNPTGSAVIADPLATGTIRNDDIFLISQIQGNAYYSPILAAEGLTSFDVASATTVIVRAVVTAVDADGTRQGFYITEETDDWDSDLNSSEGIFVMTRDDSGNGVDVATAIAGLAVGDLVTVSAQVMESQAFQSMPRTMLTNPTSILIESINNPLPVMTLDASRPIPNSIMTLVTPDYTDSADDAGDTFEGSLYALSFWETVEGMLVTIPDMVAADGFVQTSGGQPYFQAYSTVHADADQINSRGGYTVAGDPPNSPPDTADTEDNTIRGGDHLHDGDVNPDIIELDFSGFAIDAPAGLREQVTMGDVIGDVTGIVDFDFTDRKLFVTDYDPTQFVNAVPTQETTSLGNDSRSLTVATFNVENLDPTDGQARFDALAQTIANNLNSPDIIMIEEIQDNNGTGTGTNDASITWQMLVDALNAASPGSNYQWVDEAPVINSEGGQPNGNIRVGFLYDTNRVQLGNLAADATIEERRQYTDRIGDGTRDAGDLIAYSDEMLGAEINTADWSSTRRSLLGEFTFNGNVIYLAANHFTAKGGSGEFWQFNQDISAGEPENSGWEKRVAQSNDLYAMLNLIEASAPNADVITGGDFNDFYFYRPLEVATGYVNADGTPRTGGVRLDNLTLTLPEAERYTYTFDGRSQALDHILTSQSLGATATYDVVHINTGFNSLGTGADADQSLSDHDPAVAAFDFADRAEALNGTAGNDMIDGGGGDDRIGGQGGDDTLSGGEGNDSLFGDDGNDTLRGGAGNDFAYGGAGNDSVSGDDGDDFLAGDEGNDNLSGGAGQDQLHGGTGDDRLGGQAGDDYLDGDGGSDSLFGDAGNDVLRGGLENDYLSGGADNDSLYGDEGNDFLTAGEGDDYLDGGLGSDQLHGGAGNDRLAGKDGDDYLDGGAGNDGVFGDDGNDRLRGGTGSDYVAGGLGNDALYGDGDDDFLTGGEGDDYLDGGTGNDQLHGGAGNDRILGKDGDDYLDGGIGLDALFGDAGNDTIRGGAADDYVSGGLGNDVIYGEAGNDFLVGAEGDDYVDGGAGDDQLHGGIGADILLGRAGIDYVDAGEGDDRIDGGLGDDTLLGGLGNDIITGGAGADRLLGGEGADSFRYLTADESVPGAVDMIEGFVHLVDEIDLSRIDANEQVDGNQAFTLIGDAAFAGSGAASAGQLRVFQVPGSVGNIWQVEGDTDGDGDADFLVQVDMTDNSPLTGADFLL